MRRYAGHVVRRLKPFPEEMMLVLGRECDPSIYGTADAGVVAFDDVKDPSHPETTSSMRCLAG
jgi:hypothetical protein